MILKIYLAANYSKHPEMRKIRATLKAAGHIVTSRWIEGNHELGDDPSAARRFAEEDFEDLRDSNLVLWFSRTGPENRGRGGRHVEFGLALAWSIPIHVIGQKENVFHWLEQVEHFDSFESWTAWRQEHAYDGSTSSPV